MKERRSSGALPFLGVGHRPGERCVPGVCALHATPAKWPVELLPLCVDAAVGDRGVPVRPCDTGDLRKESYSTEGPGDALRRVLCSNVTRDGVAYSFHVERLNAYTHFVGACVVAALMGMLYALPEFAEAPSTSVTASRVAGFVALATFLNSGFYHVFKTVGWLNAPLLLLDFSMVFASFAANGFADVYIYTQGFAQSAWQTVADPLLSCGCVVLFLTARHFFYDKTPWTYSNCSMNILRVEVSDGLHNATRGAATFVVVVQSMLLAPALLRLAGDAVGWTVLGLQAGALLMLTGAGFLERNERPALEEWARHSEAMRQFVTAPMGMCGGLCTGHAVWHTAATLAAVIVIVAREVLLAELEDKS